MNVNIKTVHEIGSVSFMFFMIFYLGKGATKLYGKTLGWSWSISIDVYAKFYRNITKDSEFGPRQSLDRRQMAFDNPLGYIVSISMIMRNFTENFHTLQEPILHIKTWYLMTELMLQVKIRCFSKKWCYIRKCNMSELILHTKKSVMSEYMLYTNMRCVLSELMLHTKMKYIRTYVSHENMSCVKIMLHAKVCNVRAYVTHGNMMSRVRTYVTYENV